jgi:hypothetical protein
LRLRFLSENFNNSVPLNEGQSLYSLLARMRHVTLAEIDVLIVKDLMFLLIGWSRSPGNDLDGGKMRLLTCPKRLIWQSFCAFRV